VDTEPEAGNFTRNCCSTERLVRRCNILDIERMESGKGTNGQNKLATADLMAQRNYKAIMQAMADRAGVTLSGSTIPEPVVGGRIQNHPKSSSLNNAIKILAQRHYRLETQKTDLCENQILFRKLRSGAGIADKLRNNLLNLSSLMPPTHFAVMGHTGLGLAICHSIVQQHRGRVRRYSWLRGSTFYYLLPRVKK